MSEGLSVLLCHGMQVMDQVRNMIGDGVSPSQQLMAAGLDSRGAMELRHNLGARVASTSGGAFSSQS